MVIPMQEERVVWLKSPIGTIQYDKPMEDSRVVQTAKLMREHSRAPKQQPYKYDLYGAGQEGNRCYDRAIALAIKHDLVYYEGFMLIQTDEGLITIGPGFCVDDAGYVVDPTNAGKQHSQHVRYVGIPIQHSYVREQARRNKFVGVLDGHPDGKEDGIYFDNPIEWLDVDTTGL